MTCNDCKHGTTELVHCAPFLCTPLIYNISLQNTKIQLYEQEMILATSKLLNFVLCTSNISSKKSAFKMPGFLLHNISSFHYTLYTAGAPRHRSLRQADIHHRFQFKAKLLTEIFPGEPQGTSKPLNTVDPEKKFPHLVIAEFPTHLHHK